MLPPGHKCKTFGEYVQDMFVPYLKPKVEAVNRVNAVWDRYLKKSVKQSTRDTWGRDACKRMLPHATLPGN